MAEARLQVIAGGGVPQGPLVTDPWQFQAGCVNAFVASWRARGLSPVTIDNDIGLLERTLTALGRPAWEVTPEDIDLAGLQIVGSRLQQRGHRAGLPRHREPDPHTVGPGHTVQHLLARQPFRPR